MIETCRGLLVRDVEDRTVRFAHHTVQQYLLSAPVIREQGGSHIAVSSRSKAEAFVGQVCVTDLCFADFETQVALRPSHVQPEPLDVLKVGGPARIPTVLGIGRSLFEIPYRLLGGKRTTASLDIDYSKYLPPNRRPPVSSNLVEKYRLLEYIVQFWMDHTKELDPAVDAKLRHLVMYRTLPFEIRPWGPNEHFGPYGCAVCQDPTKTKELPFMSLFHYAAQAGHWTLMEDLVVEYCRHQVPTNETLLIACREGQDLIVKNLMRQIEFDISDGRAVNAAVAAGHAHVLKHPMELSETSPSDSRYDVPANAASLLNVAATNGNEEIVDTIFTYCRSKDFKCAKDSVYINKKDEPSGRNAFFSAVMSGHENIVRKFLAKGAEISRYGTTAIHLAADYGHQGVVRVLLDFAINHADGNEDVETCYINIGKKTSETYAQALLRSFDHMDHIPLHKAARNGDVAMVNLLLEYLPHTELRTRNHLYPMKLMDGLTAVHFAVKAGHLFALRALVDKGAEIAAQNSQGWHVLHFAAAEGHEAVVRYLLESGAQPHAVATDGTKALHLAVSEGHGGVVRALLDVQPENRDNGYSLEEEWDFWEVGAKNGKESVLRALFECSGSRDIRVQVGWLKSALNTAKREKQSGAVELLESFLKEISHR